MDVLEPNVSAVLSKKKVKDSLIIGGLVLGSSLDQVRVCCQVWCQFFP